MASIYITQLDSKIKSNILQNQYTVEEMLQIKESINSEIKKKKKTFLMVVIMLTSIVVLMFASLYMIMGLKEVFFVTLGMTVGAMAIIIVFVWFLTMGLLKIQYNQLIKKAYSEDFDVLYIE